MRHFTTLSDWAYLPMGLTMYDSLVQTSSEPFVLHYLCIDDQTYDKIVEIADPNLVAWRVSDLEMPEYELLEYREFVWMLQSYFTNWYMNRFRPESVTYIAADLCFYADIRQMYQEIGDASVGLIRHRHILETEDNRIGRYNAGFVYFLGDETGREMLSWWADAVFHRKYPRFATCYDQRYLEWFVEAHQDRVCIVDRTFGHSAPWQHYLFDWSRPGQIGWNGEFQTLLFNHFSQFKFDWKNDTYESVRKAWARETNHGLVFRMPGLRALYDEYFTRAKEVRVKYNMHLSV